MSRADYTVTTEAQRQTALQAIQRAPLGFNVTCKRPKRSLPQNDRLHAMITPIAQTLPWHGQMMSVDDWKLVFMDAYNSEVRIVPNINGDGFVNLGRKTSRLTKAECSDLMELIATFAAQHGIALKEQKE